jgi:FtsH-binding integral membrane protein
MSRAFEYPVIAAHAPADARAAFIRRTYGHLAGAILAFVALEGLLLQIPGIEQVVLTMSSGFVWLVILGAFMGVSWLANTWARSDTSPAMQYMGLGLYVAVESVIFLPILYIAKQYFPGAIPTAAVLTLMMFLGLTATVFITRHDFSYLGPILAIGGFLALGLIVVGILFLPNILGVFFCFAMVALASGYILYYTSNVLHHYRTDQHVAAALALFASVALLFWYILRIVMAANRR